MAKLDDFDPFAGATPPVAPSTGDDAEKPAEPPQEPPAAREPRKAPKARQKPPQGRPAATQPAATPPVVAPSAAELAMRTHWLNATAGKLGRVLTGPTGAVTAAQAWQQAVTDAREAGVGDFPIQAAALRALGQAPEAVAAIVAALADVPELQRAVVEAVGDALGVEPGGELDWLHT